MTEDHILYEDLKEELYDNTKASLIALMEKHPALRTLEVQTLLMNVFMDGCKFISLGSRKDREKTHIP